MDTVYLTTVKNESQAILIQGVLKSAGIESRLTNTTVSAIFGNTPGFQIEVHVFQKDWEAAKALVAKEFPDLA